MIKIAVLNRSTRLTDNQVALMTEAVQLQMTSQVALMWERLPPSVLFYPASEIIPADASQIVMFDSSDQAGALGYHSEGPSGEFYSKVFASPVLDAGGGVLDGGIANVSVASVLSHEAAEMFVDQAVNVWVDGPTLAQGPSYALEVGDPVEADSYPIKLLDGTEVFVSNFVGPAWFDEMSPRDATRDWMGKTTAPFAMTPGGYMVVRKAPGSEKQVYGAIMPSSWRIKGKSHPAARTARRCKIT